MTADALSFSGVTHNDGQRAALSNVTVSVLIGEMFGLTRPRWCGKDDSHPAGVRPAPARRRTRAGVRQDPATDHRAITALVGYLSQRFSLYGDLTIDENIAFQAEIHGVRSYARERDRLLAMTHDAVPRPSRRPPVGRDEAEARAGLHADSPAQASVTRRAHDRRGSGVAPRVLEAAVGVPRGGSDDRHGHPVLDEAERCGRVALLHEGVVMALDEPATRSPRFPASCSRSRPKARARQSRHSAGCPVWTTCSCSAIGRTCAFERERRFAGRVATGLKDAGIAGATVRAVPRHSKMCSSTWSPAPEMRATVSRCMEHDVPVMRWTAIAVALVCVRACRQWPGGAASRDARGSHRAGRAEQPARRRTAGARGRCGRRRGRASSSVASRDRAAGRLHPHQPRRRVLPLQPFNPLYPMCPTTTGRVSISSGQSIPPAASRRSRVRQVRNARRRIRRGDGAPRRQTRSGAGVLGPDHRLADRERRATRARHARRPPARSPQPPRSRLDPTERRPQRGSAARAPAGDGDRSAQPSSGCERQTCGGRLARTAGATSRQPQRRATPPPRPESRRSRPRTPSAQSGARWPAASTPRASAKPLPRPLPSLRSRLPAATPARPSPRIFPRVDEWNGSWDVSVNVSWSLWDGGRQRAEEAEAVASARALAARSADFDRQLAFEVEQRRLDVDSAIASIGAADVGIRAAQEAQRVVGERFAAGVATNTDVLDAQTDLLQAELDRTRAVAQRGWRWPGSIARWADHERTIRPRPRRSLPSTSAASRGGSAVRRRRRPVVHGRSRRDLRLPRQQWRR